jgi:hypothetical protein
MSEGKRALGRPSYLGVYGRIILVLGTDWGELGQVKVSVRTCRLSVNVSKCNPRHTVSPSKHYNE